MGTINVFLDTNVVIDFMGKREGFFEDASIIFGLHNDGVIHASISSLTIVNCAYILKKAFSTEIMLEKIEMLCKTFNIVPIDKNVLLNAIRMKPYDYEDAVQYFSSLTNKPDLIISRDKKGFKDFDIPVFAPAEFVAEMKK